MGWRHRCILRTNKVLFWYTLLDNKYSYLLTLCVNEILNHIISYSVSEQNINMIADPQVCLFKSFYINIFMI